ncbi:Serine acetyltransferase 3, mitochondrial [Glycine max]|nr:Serine acetyltransferase 3, mitochondrial [Glycine max]
MLQGIDGSRVQKVLESVHIAANKNTVPGDVLSMVPGGIRMGIGSSLFYILILGNGASFELFFNQIGVSHDSKLRQVNCKPVAMGENYFCSSPPPPRVRTQLVHLPIQLEPKIGSSPMEVQQRKPVVVAATIQLEHKSEEERKETKPVVDKKGPVRACIPLQVDKKDHATGLAVGETTLIGNNVSILHNVTLGGTGKASGDRHLKIGDGVLIGPGTCILGNIKIGDGAKIGACSVMLKEVPPRTTVVGNPARVVGGKDNPIKLDKVPSFTMDHTSWSDYRLIMFFNCLPNCFCLFLDYFCSSPPPPRVRTQLVHLPIQLEPKIGSSPMEVQQRKPTVAAATIQLEHKEASRGNKLKQDHNIRFQIYTDDKVS